jgi:hypothetical protein
LNLELPDPTPALTAYTTSHLDGGERIIHSTCHIPTKAGTVPKVRLDQTTPCFTSEDRTIRGRIGKCSTNPCLTINATLLRGEQFDATASRLTLDGVSLFSIRQVPGWQDNVVFVYSIQIGNQTRRVGLDEAFWQLDEQSKCCEDGSKVRKNKKKRNPSLATGFGNHRLRTLGGWYVTCHGGTHGIDVRVKAFYPAEPPIVCTAARLLA